VLNKEKAHTSVFENVLGKEETFPSLPGEGMKGER
jgi:hypothetical protein